MNLPLLVYFRGNDAFCYPELEREGYPELFEQAVAIFGVSHEIEHQLQRLGAPAEKLHYDPSGADTLLFQGSEPSHSPPTFVAVGRFVEKKAPHLTLQAFKQVWANVPETRLIMIGEGALWKNCKQLSQNLGIAHAVQFLGKQAHGEVAATLRNARAYVQHSIKTSRGASEGTPISVLEAGASGLPVVSTRHGGIQEAVIDGETGFLVQEGDVEGIPSLLM